MLRSISNISPFTPLGRFIRLPLSLVPDNATVPVLSGINKGMKWIVGSASTNACWIGTYEYRHADTIAKIVRPEMTAYDIGANVGFYTIALSRLAKHVFAFEPDARNVYYLRRHLEINGIQNVTVIQCAVSDRTKMSGFGGMREVGKITGSGSYQVPCISLDEFISMGNPVPQFIKMDVEGSERDALIGASSLIEDHAPQWVLATHSKELSEYCQGRLKQRGYQIAEFDGTGDFFAHIPIGL